MKSQIKIIALVLVLCMKGLLIDPAFARRVKDAGYPLEIIEIGGAVVNRVSVNPEYTFAFPVTVSNEHVAAYIWLRKMIEARKLPQGLTLVYLDAHHDYPVGDDRPLGSANWVNFALKNELCKEAFLVLPPWLRQSIHTAYTIGVYDNVDKVQRIYRHKLNALSDLEDLPKGRALGPVILSIDFYYFSSIGYPKHRPSQEEIGTEITRIIETLRDKNIQIAGLNLVISPGFTSAGYEAFIKQALLEAFAGYGK